MDLDGCNLEDAFATNFAGGWTEGSAQTRPETTTVQPRKNEKKKTERSRVSSLLADSSREEELKEKIPENSPVHSLKSLSGKTASKPTDNTLGSDFEDQLTTSLPIIQKMKRTIDSFTEDVPAYFGADPASDKKKQAVAPFIDYIEDEDTYNFNNADYSRSFNGGGFQRAGGAPLTTKGVSLSKRADFMVPLHSEPSENLLSEPSQLSWKGKDKGVWSSQFEKSYLVPESTRETSTNMRDKDDKKTLMEKLDKIYARLDDMEYGNEKMSENAQTETLLFVMSGLGLIFFLDLACRTASK